MEFITVEQFREQPIEVQEVFLDWWEPSIGDIYSFIDLEEYSNDTCLIQCLSSPIQVTVASNCKQEGNRIPLFTEGQLRKFIEDKTNRKSQFMLHPFSGYYVFPIVRKEEMLLHAGTDDLLQAYWKVACILAKESLNG